MIEYLSQLHGFEWFLITFGILIFLPIVPVIGLWWGFYELYAYIGVWDGLSAFLGFITVSIIYALFNRFTRFNYFKDFVRKRYP